MADLSTDALFEFELTSKFISYGVPPYIVPILLNGVTLDLIHLYRSGFHSVKASNVTETVLSTVNTVIHKYMQHDVRGVPFAIIKDAVVNSM